MLFITRILKNASSRCSNLKIDEGVPLRTLCVTASSKLGEALLQHKKLKISRYQTPQRNLFLHWDRKFKKSRNNIKKEIIGLEEYYEGIKSRFSKKESHNIRYQELENLLYMVENDDHLQLCLDILLAVINNDYYLSEVPFRDKTEFQKRNQENIEYHKFISIYLNQCLLLNSVSKAKELGQKIQVGGNSIKRYYQVLYNNECYHDILDDIARYESYPDGQSEGHNSFITLFQVAALAKLGTHQSLREISDIAHKLERDTYKNMRSKVMYSWLAFNLGDYHMAHTILKEMKRKKLNQGYLSINKYIFNLELAILIECKSVSDAITSVKALIEIIEKRKVKEHWDANSFDVCSDTMMKLISLTKEKVQHRTLEVTMLGEHLGDYEVITDCSLEEMIFEPIERMNA